MTLLNITGGDYEFENIKLHNPSAKEISEKINDEEDFLFALKILSSSLLDILPIDTPKQFSNFEIFLALMVGIQNEIQFFEQTFEKTKLKAIVDLLNLIFLNFKISISEEEVLFTHNDKIVILDNNNFEAFQKIIQSMFKTSFLFSGGSGNGDSYNPASEQARLIAEKLKKGREKVAELNNRKNKTSFIENYISIISVGLNLSPNQVSQLTLYQILTLFERFKMKIEWDLDISCRLAGGNPDEHPDHWMSIL